MEILHIALGGCLRRVPAYGITEDTGGHIAYVLGAAVAQASLASVTKVTIYTRLFEELGLDPIHSHSSEIVCDKVTIRRLATANRRYLEKSELDADLDAFTDAALSDCESLRPDVVHAHFADAARVASAIRRRFGIPFVYTPHSLALQKKAGATRRRVAMERGALASADAVVVSSRDEMRRQVSAYDVPDLALRLHCLPPGVPPSPAGDGDAMLARLAAQLAQPDRPMIVAVARPVRRKNLISLVRAFACSDALKRSANLVILAGQPEIKAPVGEEATVLAELTKAMAAPGLESVAVRMGQHSHADVPALFRHARETGGIFVNPASHEPFGLTLLEAAAAGLPVVTTCNGGPSDIVKTLGHGLLVDPHDVNALAAACLRLISDAKLHRKLSTSALRRIGRYSWTRYAERSSTLITRLPRSPAASSSRSLVVCDIDGTLTGCAEAASRFADWARLRQVGFIVATGRSIDDARSVMSHWRLPEPDAFITDVGTMIHRRRAQSGKLERCPRYQALLDEDWDRAAVARVAARLRLTPQPEANQGPHKLSFFGDAGDAAKVDRAIRAADLSARVVHSHGSFLDILAPRAGKGAAVAAYASTLGLGVEDCVAAGDSGNDADMLEACGTAIVVGNAMDLDRLTDRVGLLRVRARHADGVLEGLAQIGLHRSDAVLAA